MPKKSNFRMHAHINPLSAPQFPVPFKPSYVDWSLHFPAAYGVADNNGDKVVCNTHQYPLTYDKDLADTPLFTFSDEEEKKLKSVRVLDIGCGYGGLLYHLSELPQFKDTLMLGMEIRDKVTNFVGL